RKFDNPSAMPSTIPSEAAPALRAAVKNAGKTANTISEEKSLKRLVRPRKKMFRGKPKMRDSLLICEAEAIRQSVAKEHSPVFPSTALTCASGPRGIRAFVVSVAIGGCPAGRALERYLRRCEIATWTYKLWKCNREIERTEPERRGVLGLRIGQRCKSPAAATRFRLAAGIACSSHTLHIREARSAASGLQEQCGPQIGKSSPLRARRTRANPGEAARPDSVRSPLHTWGGEPRHRARR